VPLTITRQTLPDNRGRPENQQYLISPRWPGIIPTIHANPVEKPQNPGDRGVSLHRVVSSIILR
jgi:hypothetical protein